MSSCRIHFRYEADYLAPTDCQVDAVEHARDPVRRDDVDGQITNLEECGHVSSFVGAIGDRARRAAHLRVGSNPMTTAKIAMPGAAAYHHALGRNSRELCDHATPFRCRRLGTEPKKTERRGRENCEAHRDRSAHNNRRGDVRKNVQSDDTKRTCAERKHRLDECLVLQSARFGVGQPCKPGPERHRKRDDHILDAGSKRLRDCNRKHNLRNRKKDVSATHQDVAAPVVIVAGNQSDRDADDKRHDRSDYGDKDRDPGAEEKPAVDVGAETIGTKKIFILGGWRRLAG